MRYVVAKFEEYQIDTAYRIYISDSVSLLGQQKYIPKRWIDFIEGKFTPTENKPADEIILGVIEKGGLHLE